VELVESYQLADKMVFNSFDAHVLEYIDSKWPGRYLLHGFYPYDRMFNVSRNPDEYLYCACVDGDRIPAHYTYLLERGIEPWIGAGVTKEAHFQECFALGARLVTTNFPADSLKKLERIGARDA
jgi:glycerophosphoryl diester phosphodiesterase